jgi:Ni,Fe-hydrogenase maturation factor
LTHGPKTPKTLFFNVNNQQYLLLHHAMAFNSGYRMRKKHYTPPPTLFSNTGILETPQRANIIFAKALEQELSIPIPSAVLTKLTGASTRSQSRIAASKEVRTLHNRPDNGPDPRGRPPVITRSDVAAIEDYLSDENEALEDRGAPWLDIAEAAGVKLQETTHFKPPGKREVNSETVQRICKRDAGIIDAVCHEEKKLPKKQADNRVDFSEEQLKDRPHPIDWEDVYFCDEFHFGVGPQTTKRVKRKKGRAHRDKPMNTHRKEMPSKEVKKKVREENHLKMISVFCIVGKNYRHAIAYTVSNKVGKMTSEAYIQILKELGGDLNGITLWQDKDSAHDSKAVLDYAKERGLSIITSPGNSPDLSIMETMAHPIKKAFHSRRCASEKTALTRFRKVFGEDTDQEKINEQFSWYTKRLHECIRLGGQMTKY